MKVSKTIEDSFKPTTIHLTFETEREYKLFKQLLGNLSGDKTKDLANEVDGINDFTATEASRVIHTIFKYS